MRRRLIRNRGLTFTGVGPRSPTFLPPAVVPNVVTAAGGPCRNTPTRGFIGRIANHSRERTRPKRVAATLDHLPSMAVDAPDVDTAARLAVAHHIDNRPDPPPSGTSFALIVINAQAQRQPSRSSLQIARPDQPASIPLEAPPWDPVG